MAYVYTRSDTGFGLAQTLTTPDAANGDVFGNAVAVSGDGGTLVVGASGTSSNQGAADVTGLTQSADFPATNGSTLGERQDAFVT